MDNERTFITINNVNYVLGKIRERYYVGIDDYFTRVIFTSHSIEEIDNFIEELKRV